LDWIDQKVKADTRSPIIDMKYFMKYNPKLGFRFATDALHNLPTEAPHVILFCLNPPGALYRETVNATEVQFTTKIDWNSAMKTPQFLDGFGTFKNVEFDRNASIIIDVRSVHIVKNKPELRPVGWSVLPIFTPDGYVNSGMYQMPLFKGGVPVGLVRELSQNSPWETAVSAIGQRAGGLQLLAPVSVIVRLVDTQRDGHYAQMLDLHKMNYDYIPQDKMG
jgi:hypothetical protein